MPVEQWVNLPDKSTSLDRTTMTGDGVPSVDVMGRFVYLKATLDQKNANAIATLTVKPDGDNAVYIAGDKAYLKAQTRANAKVAANGKVKWKVKLSAAGGDKFKFEVECNGEKKELDDEFETHRRLYYQVIDMDGIVGLANLGSLETEFTKNKRFIHLHSTPSKGKIARSYNFDYKQSAFARLFNLAKAQYDTAKDPYCFAIVWVDCLAQGPKQRVFKTNSVSKGGLFDVLVTTGQLWKDIDKSPGARDWLRSITFLYTKDGVKHTFPIPEADVTSTYDKITVNTHNFPDGVTGTIRASVNIAVGFHGGWSFPTGNIIVIATRSWHDVQDTAAESQVTLVHETGHKIGQVPDGKGALKKQSTHDEVNDPAKSSHCNDTDCTMWWSTEYQKDTFCDECDKSVRKQNLYHSIRGLKRFF
jgi:hypothetical protein